MRADRWVAACQGGEGGLHCESACSRQGMSMQGRGEIVVMQQMVDSLKSSMRLLVASVRSPDDMVALASQVGIRGDL